MLAACGGSAQSDSAAFLWLTPAPPPHAWKARALPSGKAVLAFPPSWRPIRTDPGTATAAVERGGKIVGYLNATPQGGGETPANWNTFRAAHNQGEGQTNVQQLAAATDLRFRTGQGSCVVDDYTTKTGNRYREIACIVAGSKATTVVVGAAPPNLWASEAPLIERAISSFQT